MVKMVDVRSEGCEFELLLVVDLTPGGVVILLRLKNEWWLPGNKGHCISSTAMFPAMM